VLQTILRHRAWQQALEAAKAAAARTDNQNGRLIDRDLPEKTKEFSAGPPLR
jgi:sugar/nucleoside kinase (ribokinase family)